MHCCFVPSAHAGVGASDANEANVTSDSDAATRYGATLDVTTLLLGWPIDEGNADTLGSVMGRAVGASVAGAMLLGLAIRCGSGSQSGPPAVAPPVPSGRYIYAALLDRTIGVYDIDGHHRRVRPSVPRAPRERRRPPRAVGQCAHSPDVPVVRELHGGTRRVRGLAERRGPLAPRLQPGRRPRGHRARRGEALRAHQRRPDGRLREGRRPVERKHDPEHHADPQVARHGHRALGPFLRTRRRRARRPWS